MALPNQQAFHTRYQPNFGIYAPSFSQHSGQNLMPQPWNPTGGIQLFLLSQISLPIFNRRPSQTILSLRRLLVHLLPW